MVRGQHTVVVDRPAVVVFDHIADGALNKKWRPWVLDVGLRSGDGGEGSTWRQTVRGPGGKIAEADYTVTAWRRPEVYGYTVIAGPIRGAGEYTLVEAAPAETTVTLDVTLSPRGAMRVLTGFVLRQLVEELDSLELLRRVLSPPAGLLP